MKKNNICIIFFVFLLTGCFQNLDSDIKTEDNQSLDKFEGSVFNTLELTPQEQNALNRLQAKGKITIATRILSENDSLGYNLALIKQFAKETDLDIQINHVDSITDYFALDGHIPQEALDAAYSDYSYRPDLLGSVEIYVDSLTSLDWRKKAVNFVEFIPVREMVVTTTKNDIVTPLDLVDLKLIVQENSSYLRTLDSISNRLYEDLSIDTHSARDEVIQSVSNNTFDATVLDSNLALSVIAEDSALTIGIPLTSVHHVGWGVDPDQKGLTSLLDKYISTYIELDLLDQHWTKHYNMTFFEYYHIITTPEEALTAMDLSSDEITYLEEIKSDGKLKVVMRDQETTYRGIGGRKKWL